jgi:hypothetical protein
MQNTENYRKKNKHNIDIIHRNQEAHNSLASKTMQNTENYRKKNKHNIDIIHRNLEKLKTTAQIENATEVTTTNNENDWPRSLRGSVDLLGQRHSELLPYVRGTANISISI